MESYLVYMLSRLSLGLFAVLPRPAAYRLLDLLATLYFYLNPYHRHVARVNLTIAFPELPDDKRDRIAIRSFRNTARNLLEVGRMPSMTAENIRSLVEYDPVSGLNNFELARARGKGILYVTGHFSAWELLPTAHALYGHPLSFITRPLDNVYLDRHLQRVREAAGNSAIPKKNAARGILEILKSDGAIGILMDQNTTSQEGVFAELFGIPAATTASVARFALHTDASVLPGYLTPMRNRKYTIKFRPPLEFDRTGDISRDIVENTRRYNQIVESIVREQPDSWLWGHKRWKNQPPGNPPDLYALPKKELLEFVQQQRAQSVKAGV